MIIIIINSDYMFFNVTLSSMTRINAIFAIFSKTELPISTDNGPVL